MNALRHVLWPSCFWARALALLCLTAAVCAISVSSLLCVLISRWPRCFGRDRGPSSSGGGCFVDSIVSPALRIWLQSKTRENFHYISRYSAIMYADDTQNNHCIYRHYRLLFQVEIVNILYTTPICFVHFNKERSCPCCSLAPPAPLCRRVGSLRPAASKQVLFPYLDIYRCTALSKPSSHQMTLVFRRGSAYDKDKIAGLQLYTAHLTGRKRYVYTARRKLLFPPRLALFAGRCLPHGKGH